MTRCSVFAHEGKLKTQIGKVCILMHVHMQSASGLNILSVGSVFVVDNSKQVLCSFGAFGIDSLIEVPLDDTSLVGAIAVNEDVLNIVDACEDGRFNSEVDAKLVPRTTSVLCAPIFSSDDE